MSKLSVKVVSFFLALAAVFMNGCETDSATEPITITPDVVTVTNRQVVQFTASGGYEYTWGLNSSGTLAAASEMGMLSSTKGATVTYTSLYKPTTSNVVIETLKVVSTIPGDSIIDSTTTNYNATESSAQATIIHLGLTNETSESTNKLAVPPGSGNLTIIYSGSRDND